MNKPQPTLKQRLIPHINRIGNAVFFYDGTQTKKSPLMANRGLQMMAKQRYGMDFSYLNATPDKPSDNSKKSNSSAKINGDNNGGKDQGTPNQ